MKAVMLLAVGIVVSGCVTSRSPDCSEYTLQLGKEKLKKSISFSLLRTSHTSSGKEFEPCSATPAFQGAWAGSQSQETAIAQLKGVFDPVATSVAPITVGKETEIKLEIHQQNTYNELISVAAFFHGFTFGCIPCWGDDVYYLSVRASNNKGLTKNYLLMRDVTTVSWLPLILVMPFSELPATAVNMITMENWKELKMKLENDGFFD